MVAPQCPPFLITHDVAEALDAPQAARRTMAEASAKRNRNLPQQLTLDHVSPATRLLEKRRQMFEVQEALDAQKEEFQRREATFKRREEMLKKKDLELQESLIKFNKFLQENDSKRSRAEKKEKDEVKQRLVKEQEITKLQEALMQQKEQRRVMTIELDKMMKHQSFLESVLDATEEFPEITDLLSRYETLDAAHSDLISRQVQAEEHNEAERHELTQFVRDKTDEILARHPPLAPRSPHPPHAPPTPPAASPAAALAPVRLLTHVPPPHNRGRVLTTRSPSCRSCRSSPSRTRAKASRRATGGCRMCRNERCSWGRS